jgi:hypothetical protein
MQTIAQSLSTFLKFARVILCEENDLNGEPQFTLPDALKVRPISDQDNLNEIIGKFGGADQLRNAVIRRQLLLYSA